MNKIIYLFFIIVLVLVSGCSNKCSYWHKENCDKSCNVDEDCKQSTCCSCINKDESCATIRKVSWWTTEAVSPNCLKSHCQCINNQCQGVEK